MNKCVNEKILNRINNLLAMSKDTTNIHEAAIATRRVHSLLAKYNLSESELPQDSDSIDKSEFDYFKRSWVKRIVHHIASLYFCDTYYDNTAIAKSHNRFHICGNEINRKVAIDIIHTVLDAVKHESLHVSRETHGEVKNSFVTSFRNAAALRIAYRCTQLIRQAKAGTLRDEDDTNLPVLKSVYDRNTDSIAAWYKQKDMEFEHVLLKTDSKDTLGVARGHEMGNRISLTRSLSSVTNKQLEQF